jgi:hypothetical protein
LGELTPEEIDERNKLMFESCSRGGHNSTMTQWLKLVRPNLSDSEIKQLIADGIKYESFSPEEQAVISQNQSTLGQNSVMTRWLKLVRPNLSKAEIKQLITDGIKYESFSPEEQAVISQNQSALGHTGGHNSTMTRWLKLVRPNLSKAEIKQLITDGIKYENLTTEERSKIRGQQRHSTAMRWLRAVRPRISDVEFELLRLDKTFTIDNFSDE